VKLNTLTTAPEAEQVNNGKGLDPQAVPKSHAWLGFHSKIQPGAPAAADVSRYTVRVYVNGFQTIFLFFEKGFSK